jgi:hypothetical protein
VLGSFRKVCRAVWPKAPARIAAIEMMAVTVAGVMYFIGVPSSVEVKHPTNTPKLARLE